MAEKKIIKKYQKEDLTILWEPEKCIHSGECVRRLPKVYDPRAKPWLKPENASKDALQEQIDHCPSGALSYELEGKVEPDSEVHVRIIVKKDGPFLVHGDIILDYEECGTGKKEKVTAFCRCGSSKNKPYCDGSHKKIEFKG